MNDPAPLGGADSGRDRADTVLDCAYAVVDRIMLVAPSCWSRLLFSFTTVGKQQVFASLDAKVSSDWPLLDCPGDPFRHAARLSAAFRELAAALAVEQKTWRFGGASAQRSRQAPSQAPREGTREGPQEGTRDGPIRLELLDDGASVAGFDLEPERLCFGSELLLALDQGAGSWAERQRALDASLAGHLGWTLRPDDGRLEWAMPDGSTLVAAAALLGSCAAPSGRWRWAWADPRFDHLPPCLAAVRGLAEQSRAWPGMGVFRLPSFDIDIGFTDALALLAADRLGGLPVFCGRAENQTVYAALSGPLAVRPT
jgi:hypothetical protein